MLAVCSGGSFGALGLSRRLDLMYKPQHYKVSHWPFQATLSPFFSYFSSLSPILSYFSSLSPFLSYFSSLSLLLIFQLSFSLLLIFQLSFSLLLMYIQSLSDLIQDYIQCYANCKSATVDIMTCVAHLPLPPPLLPSLPDHHKVVKVRLSSLIPHNLHSCEQITWKV